MNIVDHAITAAESPALIVADGDTISFGRLHARSQRVAAMLRGAGLRRGDGVALVLPNRPEFFEITADKKVVWQFEDHANFKTINQIQVLDVKGDVTKGEIIR